MRKYLLTALIAVACSLVVSWSYAVFFAGIWLLLPCIGAVGIVMAVAIHETRATRFLGRLLVGSLIFGVLSVGLFALRAAVIAWWTHDPHPPFEASWSMVLWMGPAAGLAFFGGLIGIALKGIYVMAGRWADRVLLFVAPLALMVASLAVERVKYGGTIVSHVHGWPYPLATYAVGDIDGTPIGQWHASFGTLLSNPIRNYLFFIFILAGVYLLTRSVIEMTGRRAVGNPIATGVLFGLTLVGIIGLASYIPVCHAYVQQHITKAGYCTGATDCEIVMNHGAFGCATTVNRSEARRIRTLMTGYPEDFRLNSCGEAEARCDKGTCTAWLTIEGQKPIPAIMH